MKSALGKYLAQLRQGEAFNYEAFLKYLPPAISARHLDYFQVERVSKQRWRVSCSDPALLAQLEEQASTPSTRRQAALKGDSHRQRTGAAFLLSYHEALPDTRPDVICLTSSSSLANFEIKTTALVIENEDNFAQFRQMLEFTSGCLGEAVTLSNCDVILGGGNRVSRKLVTDWLAGYQRVLCAFDYDLGGLKMFASLKNHLGTKAIFLQPGEWSQWREAFQLTPGTPDRLVEAVKRANDMGFVGLAQMFRDTQKFMEQETLLDDE